MFATQDGLSAELTSKYILSYYLVFLIHFPYIKTVLIYKSIKIVFFIKKLSLLSPLGGLLVKLLWERSYTYREIKISITWRPSFLSVFAGASGHVYAPPLCDHCCRNAEVLPAHEEELVVAKQRLQLLSGRWIAIWQEIRKFSKLFKHQYLKT